MSKHLKDVKYRKDESKEIYLYQPVMPEPDAVRVGFMYPASYQIAMSALGYLVLFQHLDQNPEVAADRVYMDTLEQYDARRFELMGFSFSFELDTISILKTLETYHIPFYSRERERSHPLVFAGGPVPMSNPEPFAEFFDFFIIGEGEEVMQELIQVYKKYRDVPDREELLHHLAREIEGVYVPAFYEVAYEGPEGPIQSITPKYGDIPAIVNRRMTENMDEYVAATPILSDKAIFSNTFLLEVMRGCAHRCRFCLASYATLPARAPSLQPVLDILERGMQYTDKVGLLGALISNHPRFPELCDWLSDKMDSNPNLSVSSSSLRVDTLTSQIVETFKKGKQRQLTLAVETGSDKLRRRINKNLRHEQILDAADKMEAGGMKGMKIYGIVGLPDEDERDVELLGELMQEIHQRHPKLELVLGCSSFVPKGGTPFQWMRRMDNKTVEHRFGILKKQLAQVCDFRPSSTKWDYFQAWLSRGDRRLVPLLVRFYELGGSLGSLARAYKELKAEGKVDFPEPDWYALRERPAGEILPWEMITLGVSKEILYKEGLPPPGFQTDPPELAIAGSRL